ncbi:unnamed protein product, partial [Hapterophycus canaliculatus]
FDRVFKPGVEQVEVYEEVKHVAHGVSQGFNGTIFAYGQTGSGKTYTMGGSTEKLSFARASAAASDVPEAGVIPRAVSTLLADAEARKAEGWEFALTATYVEIYNERIRDLLNPANDNLQVGASEHPSGRGVEAAGAKEVRVSTLEEAVAVLRKGAEQRATAATLMNNASSRSHSIFMLRLEQVCV